MVEGALVENALREAKDALFGLGNPGVTWGDAVVEVASRSLGGVSGPRADRYRVYVHVDAQGAWVNARGSVAHEVASRLGCTAGVAPVWMAGGVPVSVGRSQRAVPGRTRRLVQDRDRGCVFPGCGASRFVEIHHVTHWADGGGTDYANLVCLCPRHHDAHHAGAFQLVATGDPLVPVRVTTRWGQPIHAQPPEPRPPRPGPCHGSGVGQSPGLGHSARLGHSAGLEQSAGVRPGDPGRPASPGDPGITQRLDPRPGDDIGAPAPRDHHGARMPWDAPDAGDPDAWWDNDTDLPAGQEPVYVPPLGERLDHNWVTFAKDIRQGP